MEQESSWEDVNQMKEELVILAAQKMAKSYRPNAGATPKHNSG